MTHNIPLMRMIHRQITTNTASHDQSTYMKCVAGWAVRFDGHWGLLNPASRFGGTQVIDFRTGEIAFTDEIAAQLLGLAEDEADYLFHDAGNKAAVAWLEDMLSAHDTRVLDELDWPIGEVTA